MALRLSSYLKHIIIPAIGTGIMIFLPTAIQQLGNDNLSIFMSSIVFGIALYMGVIALMSRFYDYDLIDQLKQVLTNIR